MTNEELIQDMKDHIARGEYEGYALTNEECEQVIQVLEQQRWIPVTEDTPPKGTICLWCNKQGSVFTSAITYRSECSSYVGKHGYFSNGLENYGDIVAWMPSPQPYKAESEDKESESE